MIKATFNRIFERLRLILCGLLGKILMFFVVTALETHGVSHSSSV